MLRESQYILRQVNIALDLALCVGAFFVAHGIRTLLSVYVLAGSIKPSTMDYYVWLLPAAPLVIVLALGINGVYRSLRLRTRTLDLARSIAVACLEGMLVLFAIDSITGSLLRPEQTDRTSQAMMLILPVVCFIFILVKTHLVRRALTAARRRGLNYRNVILVGSGPPLEEFAGMMASHPIWGLKIEGIITDREEFQGEAFDAQAVPEASEGRPVLADLERAPEVLWSTPVDEVIFVPNAASLGRLRPLMEICEEMGVRMHLPLNFFAARIARPVVDRFEDVPVLSYWPTRDIGPSLLFKYAFDRVAAPVLLVLCSVVMIPVALAIKLTSKRGEPIFFGQTRCGLNGRLFTCWKFRTMRSGAEQEREHLEQLNEQQGPVFKIHDDPRVTRVGRLLRKFSIDELPQLWNVIRGEMSLVGPRPPLPGEVKQYDRWQRRRLSMKPGITCLWQVSGRNMLPFETWMKLDLQYIDNWSLLLDFKILLRTVYVVVTGYGAM